MMHTVQLSSVNAKISNINLETLPFKVLMTWDPGNQILAMHENKHFEIVSCHGKVLEGRVLRATITLSTSAANIAPRNDSLSFSGATIALFTSVANLASRNDSLSISRAPLILYIYINR